MIRTTSCKSLKLCMLCGIGLWLLGCSPPKLDESLRDDVAKSSVADIGSVIAESADQRTKSSKAVAPQVSLEAFRFAAYEGNVETVRQALESGMDVNSANAETKLTPLHMAAYNGHTDVVRILLEHGARVDALDHEGKTPLTHACTGPFQETVQLLVDSGADINAKESTEGFTPLMMAAGLGETEVVKILLQHKADSTIRDNDGDRAIDHATNSGHAAIVKLLQF